MTTTRRWEGKRALVTGGLGFVGNAVVRRLVSEGASVRVLDALLPQAGGSPRNLRGLATNVDVIVDDTRSRDAVDRAVRHCDVVFHLAGHAGFSALAPDWYSEIDSACLGTLNVLEAIRVHAPHARLVFGSALAVYGRPAEQPVREDAPTDPLTIFGVHKLAGEKYCSVYHSQHGVRTVAARIAWLFGPRQRLTGAANGTIANALDAAIHEEAILLPADGAPKLDVLHVDDAVTALLALALAPECVDGLTVNVGRGTGHTLREIAEHLIGAVGRGVIRDLPAAGSAGASIVTDVARLRTILPKWAPMLIGPALDDTVRWYRGEDDAA